MPENFIPTVAGEFVELRIPDGNTTVARRLPGDGCAIALTVPAAAIRALRPGDRVELGSLPPLELLRLRGKVMSVNTIEARSHVVIDACTENFHWHPHFVERRNAVRVRPSLLRPLAARLKSGATILTGRVIDVSIEGLAMFTPKGKVDVIDLPIDVDLQLRLPGAAQELCFAARAIRAEEIAGGVTVAARFDMQQSIHFSSRQRELQNYLLRRQSELVTVRERTGTR